MKLYGYWQSSSTWRVRIALAYKGLSWTDVPVSLINGAGEQHDPDYRQLNPMAQVPVLVLENGIQLSQSLGILEYLEERYPEPHLLPTGLAARARVRQFAEVINSGIQPLQNLSVLRRLSRESDMDSRRWARSVIETGLDALEEMARSGRGDFLVGDRPTYADVCLVPQLYNARRFGCDIVRWPRLGRSETAAMHLSAFNKTRPENFTDARATAA